MLHPDPHKNGSGSAILMLTRKYKEVAQEISTKKKHQALPKSGLFTSSSEAGSTSLVFPHWIALPSLKKSIRISRSLVDPNLLGSGFGYRIWIKKGQK
jgi:hypothetical protein